MPVEVEELRLEDRVVVGVGAAVEGVDDRGAPWPGDLRDALLLVRGRG